MVKTNRRRTNRRRTNGRRTNGRRTNGRKTNHRKTNRRKTNRRKTNRRKTNRRKIGGSGKIVDSARLSQRLRWSGSKSPGGAVQGDDDVHPPIGPLSQVPETENSWDRFTAVFGDEEDVKFMTDLFRKYEYYDMLNTEIPKLKDITGKHPKMVLKNLVYEKKEVMNYVARDFNRWGSIPQGTLKDEIFKMKDDFQKRRDKFFCMNILGWHEIKEVNWPRIFDIRYDRRVLTGPVNSIIRLASNKADEAKRATAAEAKRKAAMAMAAPPVSAMVYENRDAREAREARVAAMAAMAAVPAVSGGD